MEEKHMKTNKLWKRFWTLNVHDHAGFTLVELIVVIAILAILAAVAVPAYSGYIEKTNKTLDESLVSEVKQGLELHYYSDPTITSAMVMLNKEGTTAEADDAGNAAMVAVFGQNWKNTVGLKFDGWQKDIRDENGLLGKYNAKELVQEVEGLTDSLGKVIAENPGLVGETDSFKGYASDLLDIPQDQLSNEGNAGKVADAAVLYVADLVSGYKSSSDMDGKLTNFQTQLTPDSTTEGRPADAEASLGLVLTESMNLFGGNILLGTSAAYAMMMSFCEDMEYPIPTLKTEMVTNNNSEQVGAMLIDAFGPLTLEPGFEEKWTKYVKEQATNDIKAFMDVMDTVNTAKSQVVGNLGASDCFSSGKMENLLASYTQGGIIVWLEFNEDGTVAAQDSRAGKN